MKEDVLHKIVNNYLFIYSLEHKELVFYTYMPFGEKRTPITGALLKAKGAKRGVSDFMLIFNNGITYWLECKVKNEKQTLEQLEFEAMIKNKIKNHYYFIVKDLDYLDFILKNKDW